MHPFDLKSALFARHAQHVVLVHFPIALFLFGVGFDLFGQWRKKRMLAAVAYYDLLVAAVSSLPVVATGVLAWRWQLEGQRLKGILLRHLVMGLVSGALIWLVSVSYTHLQDGRCRMVGPQVRARFLSVLAPGVIERAAVTQSSSRSPLHWRRLGRCV